MLSVGLIARWMERAADLVEENRDYLTRLDAALGDADHGINMSRGFKKVLAVLSKNRPREPAGLLKAVAMALMSSVGGAAGPLYGTFFLKASSAASTMNENEPLANNAAALMRAGLEGVVERGRAQAGDKTMVDALVPAVKALERCAGEGNTLDEALSAAADAAEQGMKDTVPMTARRGRASYLGERSVGHQDPGATSAWLLVKAFLEAAASDGTRGAASG